MGSRKASLQRLMILPLAMLGAWVTVYKVAVEAINNIFFFAKTRDFTLFLTSNGEKKKRDISLYN